MPDRRLFLTFLGLGLTGMPTALDALGPLRSPESGGAVPFTPIQPSDADAIVLPRGYDWQPVALWPDPLPGTATRFGYNADYTALLPIPGRPDEFLLWVNHEYVSIPNEKEGHIGVYTQTFPLVMGRQPTLEDELHDVGASVLHLRRETGRWRVIGSPLTRRYDARTTMAVSGPALRHTTRIAGTLANCAGAVTPWNTVLTCEENFQEWVPEDVDTQGLGRVGGRFKRNGAHYGWVVEVDPFDPSFVPVKHTMLGRFRHENVAVRATPGSSVVAYMGDDRTNGHVYKFVSRDAYVPGNSQHRGTLLSRGRLYAAVFRSDGTGEWRELADSSALQPNPMSDIPAIPRRARTLGHVYRDVGAIVTDACRASNLIGATPTGRPEDIEIHPRDGSVYIAFTDIATAPGTMFSNVHGEIWRLDEEDPAGRRFSWMRWQAGGPNDAAQAGYVYGAPDNLAFDRAGNLWVVTDMKSVRMNAHPEFTTFKNNGMFFVPAAGSEAGRAFQFASAPCEAEFTGPSWTPDERTMFVAVQHPGEATGMRLALERPPRGSNWPSGRVGDPPRPGVIAVSPQPPA